MCRVQGFAEQLASLGASVAPPEHGPEIGECSGSFERRPRVLARLDGLAEQDFAALVPRDETGGAFRHAQRARRTERPCKPELFLGETEGGRTVTECELRERSIRSPGEVSGADDERSRQERADGQEVLQALRDLPSRDTQPPSCEEKNDVRQEVMLGFGVELGEHVLGCFEPTLLHE